MSFEFYRCPKVLFGSGRILELGKTASRLGSKALVVTGANSLDRSGNWDKIAGSLASASVILKRLTVKSEPSPEIVDTAVREFQDQAIHVVIAVGGGSVIDCAKAIAAMLPLGESVNFYLEGVGHKNHPGKTLPLIAVPTTAGTGSEATKNAVLSSIGKEGFKKSLRHDNFTPLYALLDPELTLTCPPLITAACGMDAFTQLLESYLSTKGSPLTDALSLSGIKYLSPALLPAATDRGDNIFFRSSLLYGAFLSGVTLANAGLGIIHGLAGPVGARTPMPHGMVCATLVGEACRMNILRIREQRGKDDLILEKYARVGRIICGNHLANDDQACDLLLEKLKEWIRRLRIPRLGAYGIQESDLDALVARAGQKANPILLDRADVKTILKARL
ncbi:MAG: iron-containing alcohol dehydrogenase [Deltaproteobacteria bacterium]|nr:iron-containing alcohol dehydrogenase [Deltaproteobacteria bacterium]